MLPDYVHTFGQWLLAKHGERVHKIALDVGFTCPNRDGSKGIGGCTFCNNASFSPNGRESVPLYDQIDSGRSGIDRCTRAKKYLAYFQAYTNTYADVQSLRVLYDQALGVEGMIGLSVGTRPDCVPPAVLDLLAEYHDRGMEVWLELGLQSAFDESLEKVNRGHGLKEYIETTIAARRPAFRRSDGYRPGCRAKMAGTAARAWTSYWTLAPTASSCIRCMWSRGHNWLTSGGVGNTSRYRCKSM